MKVLYWFFSLKSTYIFINILYYPGDNLCQEVFKHWGKFALKFCVTLDLAPHLFVYSKIYLYQSVQFSCSVMSDPFLMSQFFTSDGRSIGVSASTSVLPMNTQDWSPLGWTGWISLQSKGFSRVFFNTTVQKHQFFCAQLSSQSNSHIHTWPLEKP